MTQAQSDRDPDSVYRVVQLVASDADSWEAAAAAAIADATKTITDLRVAQVVELDTAVRDGKVVAYRVRLKVSYRIDRRRRSAAGETEMVRRYLVVANQTVGGKALSRAISERLAAGPAEFHVLVPATLSRDYASARRLATFSVDPTSGYTFGDLGGFAFEDEQGRRRAQERLDEQLLTLIQAGAQPSGEVGDSDPMTAIATVLARADFDEILLSTLPATISRWVGLDLPTRLARRFGRRVTHLEEPD